MIKFDPNYPDLALLTSAVKWARRNRDYIPSLTALAPRRDLDDLTKLGAAWQKAGLGRMIEVSEEGQRSVLFSLDDAAVAAVEVAKSNTILGRLSTISRSDWIALGAFIVSLFAFFKGD